MENALFEKTHKAAKRKMRKQGVEKRRRDKIKKRLEELSLLIPEARKRLLEGKRLRQVTILQLTVDYIRSSCVHGNLKGVDVSKEILNTNQTSRLPSRTPDVVYEENQEKEDFQPFNSRGFFDNTCCQQCPCPCMPPFQRSECNQRLPLWGGQSRHRHLPFVQGEYNTLPPPGTRLGMNNTWGVFRPISLLGACRNSLDGVCPESDCSGQASNHGESSIDIAMETKTASAQPLEALQSLCSSISSNAFAAQAMKYDLHAENLSKCVITSKFELASRLPPVAVPRTIATEILQPTTVLPWSLETPTESQDLWRPWD